jgi:hypothetical protein
LDHDETLIEPEYTDTWGRRHSPSEETTRLILESLNKSLGAGSAPEQPIDATLVVREDADSISLRVPAGHSGTLKLEIQWESGELEHHWFWLPELPDLSPGEKRFPLPKPLRLGYHALRLYWVTQPELSLFAEARLIVCPQSKAGPREWR